MQLNHSLKSFSSICNTDTTLSPSYTPPFSSFNRSRTPFSLDWSIAMLKPSINTNNQENRVNK